MSVLYEDKYLIIDDHALTIKNYFFPMGAKRIAFEQVKTVKAEPLTLLNGKFRLWGMGLEPKWFHFDLERMGKKHCLILDIGEFMKPAITPKSHDTVLEILQEKIKG